MKVVKCDWCGKIVVTYYSVTAVYVTDNLPCDSQVIGGIMYRPQQQYDLCDDCMKQLKEMSKGDEDNSSI